MALIHILDKQTDKIIGTLNNGQYHSDEKISSSENANKLDFTALKHFDILTKRNRLLLQDKDSFFSEYLIIYAEQNLRTQKFISSNASFTDLQKAKIIEPQTLQGATSDTATDTALAGTEWKKGRIDYNGIRTLTIEEYTNPYKLLKTIASEFGLVLRFRVAVEGNKIVRYVDMKLPDDEFDGKETVFGKDLVGLRRIEDAQSIVTALLVLGPDKEDGTRLTVLVEDNGALQRWGRSGQHLIEEYEPQMSNKEITADELRSLGETELKKRIDAIVTYEGQAAVLEHIPGKEHEKVRLDYTIRIKDDGYTPPLYLEAKVLEIKEQPSTGKIQSIKLGNYKENSKADLEAQIADLKKQLADRLSKLVQVTVTSSAGSVFNNGAGSTTLTAVTILAGKEVDTDGTIYTYKWAKYDKNGNYVTSRTGKSIEVLAGDIDVKATYIVTVEKDGNISIEQITITAVNDGAQGPQGLKGNDGYTPIKGVDYFDGEPGQNGQSSYLWVRYSQNANGNPMTTDPTGAKYIGIATTTTEVAPTGYASYTWSLVKGTDGIPGEAGSDGRTSYLHIKYSDDGQTFTANNGETVGKYIGTYVDFTETDSTNFNAYTWNKVRGEDGYTPIKGVDYFDGQPGQKGADGSSSYLWVKYSLNSNGNPMTDSPAGALYIGIAITTSPSAPSSYTAYKWTLIKGTDGVPGEAGADGKTSYLHIKYSNDGGATFSANNGETVGDWIGTYVDFTQADSNSVSAYTWNKVKGEQGPQGVQGPKGADGQSLYTWVKYADSPTTGMADTPTGKKYIGLAYNKTSATESSVYADYSWSLIEGPQGVQGPPGADGTTTYTWIKYADDAQGNGMSDSPAGKRYLGLAFNKTTATESTNKADYNWSPLYDNVIVGGTNLFLDSFMKRVSNALGANATFTRASQSPTDLIRVDSTNVGTYFGLTTHSVDRFIEYMQGKDYTLSFEVRGNVTNFNYVYMMRNSSEGGNSSFNTTNVSLSETEWQKVVMFKNAPWSTNTGYLLLCSRDVGVGKWFEIRKLKIEQSNVASDWSSNPQEIQGKIDDINTTLADISSDSKLTPIEKQLIKKEWDIIVSEKPTIEAQGTLFGITTEKTAYTNVYNALDTYISPLLSSLTTTSDIVADTFRTNFKSYYDAKTAILKKVADLTKIYGTYIDETGLYTGKFSFNQGEGGQLKLGAKYGNGELYVYDATGNAIGRIALEGANFPRVQSDDFVGNIVNKYPKYAVNDVYYFDVTNGNDANDGLASTRPKRNLQNFINNLPKDLNQCTITLKCKGTLNAELRVEGLRNGNFQITEWDASNKMVVKGSFFAMDCHRVFIKDTTFHGFGGAGNAMIHAYYTHDFNAQNVKCYGGTGQSHAFWMVNSNFLLETCEVYNIGDRGLYATRMSTGVLANGKGNPTVCVLAEDGAYVSGYGTRWAGSLTGRYGGSSWDAAGWSSVNFGEASPPTPPAPTEKLLSVTASTGDNYSTLGFWTSNEVKQADAGYGTRRGIWYFDLSAIKGKTILSATITIDRKSGSGVAAARTVHFRTHQYDNRNVRPGGAPTMSGVGASGTIAIGEVKTFDITAMVQTNIASGIDKSIGVYTTGTTDYMSLGINPTLNIRYQ